MIMIRAPKEEDWAFWHSLDGDLPFDRFLRKVRDRQGYLLFSDGEPAAVLHFGLFLDRIPFAGMPPVVREARFSDQHLDLALLSWWEQDMLFRGYDRVLVHASPGSREEALFRSAGYREAGALVPDSSGAFPPPTLFLTKPLKAGCACGREEAQAQ